VPVFLGTVGKRKKNKWRITNMKNVKVILISVALCATVFANARIEALGGDAGFWPGDRANVELFPGALNDGNWVEFGGVQGTTPSASINWGEDVKWGFNFGGADNNDWVNMSWAKDGMGLSVSMLSSLTNADAELGVVASEMSGFNVAWGQTMSFGELGVSYSTTDDAKTTDDAATALTVNWRNACDAWLFDNAKAALSMTDSGAGVSGMALTYDMFTHVKPADGVTALFGLGFAHASTDTDVDAVPASCTDEAWDGADEASCTGLGGGAAYDGGSAARTDNNTQMWLPNAILAVEASMTDWATVRAFVKQTHVFSQDDDTVAGDANTGNLTDAGFGVGFGWTTANGSSVSLDMEVSNSLFTDPISTMTGYKTGDLANGEVTISYEF